MPDGSVTFLVHLRGQTDRVWMSSDAAMNHPDAELWDSCTAKLETSAVARSANEDISQDTGDPECDTRKDKYRRMSARSAGIEIFAWSCGTIVDVVELFRSESPRQVQLVPLSLPPCQMHLGILRTG